MRELRSIQKWINEYHALATQLDDLEVLLSFYKSGEAEETEVTALHQQVEEAFESLEFRNMLSEEGDALSAYFRLLLVLAVQSCDWAQMLMRMYLMWGEKNGLKFETQPPAGGCGNKTVTLELEGEFAFGWLKGESKFTVWYAFPLDSNAKRTSFASVYVYPLVDESIEV